MLWLFVLPSVLFAVLVMTNGSHHAVRPELAAAASVYAPSAGVVGWAALGHHTMLGLFNLVVLVRLFLLSNQHRPPVGLMIVGQVVLWTWRPRTRKRSCAPMSMSSWMST